MPTHVNTGRPRRVASRRVRIGRTREWSCAPPATAHPQRVNGMPVHRYRALSVQILTRPARTHSHASTRTFHPREVTQPTSKTSGFYRWLAGWLRKQAWICRCLLQPGERLYVGTRDWKLESYKLCGHVCTYVWSRKRRPIYLSCIVLYLMGGKCLGTNVRSKRDKSEQAAMVCAVLFSQCMIRFVRACDWDMGVAREMAAED